MSHTATNQRFEDNGEGRCWHCGGPEAGHSTTHLQTTPYIAYFQMLDGVYREVDGVMSGPHTREELGLAPDQYLPECQTLRASGAGASVSFGFGYGLRRDNTFERSSGGAA